MVASGRGSLSGTAEETLPGWAERRQMIQRETFSNASAAPWIPLYLGTVKASVSSLVTPPVLMSSGMCPVDTPHVCFGPFEPKCAPGSTDPPAGLHNSVLGEHPVAGSKLRRQQGSVPALHFYPG